jgi:hypothetical protein
LPHDLHLSAGAQVATGCDKAGILVLDGKQRLVAVLANLGEQ